MLEQGGLQVLIKAGSGGSKPRTLPYGSKTRDSEYIEVSYGLLICVCVKILSSFRWETATALSMQVKLGTIISLLPQMIARPAQPSEVKFEQEKWNVWQSQTKTWVAASFEFCDLSRVSS